MPDRLAPSRREPLGAPIVIPRAPTFQKCAHRAIDCRQIGALPDEFWDTLDGALHSVLVERLIGRAAIEIHQLCEELVKYEIDQFKYELYTEMRALG